MKARSETFIKNLDKAVIEHRKLACPNMECDDMIISREIVQPDQSSKIHYWCRNGDCRYHRKRTIVRARTGTSSNTRRKEIGESRSFALSKVEKGSFSLLAYLMMIPVALINFLKAMMERLD